METLFCPWEPASFLFISSNVPTLIHYSHFIAMFAAMAVSLLVFFSNPSSLLSRLFLLFSLLFSTWALLDVSLWATNDPAIVMFAWSMQILIEPVTFAIAFYLFYIFLNRRTPSFALNATIMALLLPLIVLLPTALNLEALQLSTCESIEGPLAKYYTYILMIVFVGLIIHTGFKHIPKLPAERKSSARLFIVGLVTFLLAFTSGNIISSFTDDWTISQYGLFGMPIFASLIAYSIVQYKAFQIQATGAQFLVVTLWALTASLLFVEAEVADLITGATLMFTTVVGLFLVKSVRQEFLQRIQLEELTGKLEKANVRLKALDKQKSEFVSIASHQLRSPITSIRGYASLMLEGTYGNVTKKMQEPLERIEQSSRLMATAIEDYLNVSRIEAGNMKYNLSDFNLRDEVDHVCDDLRPQALKEGIVLLFRTDLKSKGVVHADLGKTVQIVQNLITNAIKYTKEGSITVRVWDDVAKNKKIYVDVTDTGIGMSKETLHTIFQKFERAENANSVNIHGTGLGLFVALKMAQAMKGTITAHSEGDGKGSRFTFELPLSL